MKIFNVTKSWTQAEYSPDLTQRAFLNAVASLLDYGVKIGVSLLVTPILVSGLGSTLFGVWQILNRLIGYISVADGRPTQALKWVIANQQQSEDHASQRRMVGSALGVWLVLLPFLSIVGAFLVWLSPMIAKVPLELENLVRVTCVLLVANLVLTVFVGVPESVLRGMNQGYKRMGVVASLNILGGALTVLAIHLNWGLIGVAMAQVAITVVTGILFWRLVKTYITWFGVERVSVEEIRQFFGLSMWYSVWNLVNKLILSSDVVVLGLFMSAIAVTNYVLTGYVVSMTSSIVVMMVGATLPGLGGLIGQRRYAQVIQIRNEMLWMNFLLATVLGSMTLLWNRSFIALWVGSEHYAGSWVNLLLVIIAVQQLFFRGEAFVIDLTLDLRRKVVVGLIAALLSVVLAVLLIPLWGIVGLCMGVLLGRIVLTVIYPAIIGAFLGISLRAQLETIFRPVLVMLISFTVFAYAGTQVFAAEWLTFFVYVGLSFPVMVLFQFLFGFSSHQRQCLLQRLGRFNPWIMKA